LCIDIFWGIASELGFVHIDVEPVTSSNMMEALNDRYNEKKNYSPLLFNPIFFNRKTYGFIVCKPNSDRSIGDISERERQDSRNMTILMEQHDNMSPTTAVLSILFNSNAYIDGDSADRFNFFRERLPEVNYQNSFFYFWNIQMQLTDKHIVNLDVIGSHNSASRRSNIQQCAKQFWVVAFYYIEYI
jgi:hypothetical protein